MGNLDTDMLSLFLQLMIQNIQLIIGNLGMKFQFLEKHFYCMCCVCRYQLAENIDAQLKRMLSDLKEIIDHLNSSNTNQDQTDPVRGNHYSYQ